MKTYYNRYRPIHNAYVVRLLAYTVQQMFFPYLAILLLDRQLLETTSVALVVGAGIFSLRVTALIFAKITTITPKKTICAISYGLLGIAFLLCYLFISTDTQSVFAWFILNTIIGGLLSVGSLATISLVAINTEPEHYNMSFSKIAVAITIGNGLGYFIGSRLIDDAATYIPLVAMMIVLAIFITSTFLPKDCTLEKLAPHPHHEKINKPFLVFLLINFLTIFAYSHFYDVFPLYANDTLGSNVVGNLYIINTVMIIGLQLFITKLSGKLDYNTSVIASNILFALGIVGLSLSNFNWLYIVLLGMIIGSFAEMVFVPIYHTLAIKLYAGRDSVYPLALMTFTWGVAEALAIFVAINLIERGFGIYSYLIAIGMCLLVVIICMSKKSPFKHAFKIKEDTL